MTDWGSRAFDLCWLAGCVSWLAGLSCLVRALVLCCNMNSIETGYTQKRSLRSGEKACFCIPKNKMKLYTTERPPICQKLQIPASQAGKAKGSIAFATKQSSEPASPTSHARETKRPTAPANQTTTTTRSRDPPCYKAEQPINRPNQPTKQQRMIFFQFWSLSLLVGWLGRWPRSLSACWLNLLAVWYILVGWVS